MAGFIILSDGRAYATSNWGYDRTIEAIVETLPDTQECRMLAAWLLDQRSTVQGMGLGSVDLRELTPRNQELFLRAVEDAYRKQKDRGPVRVGVIRFLAELDRRVLRPLENDRVH